MPEEPVSLNDVIAWCGREVVPRLEPQVSLAYQLGKCQAALYLALGSETARQRLIDEMTNIPVAQRQKKS